MPTEFRIDPSQRIVRSTARGVLTEDESWVHYDRIASDPRFQPTFCQLCDLREVEEIEASTTFLRALANRSIFAPDARRAFVAHKDMHFGLARMLRVFAEEEGTEIGVFRTVEEAEAWLGVPGEAADS